MGNEQLELYNKVKSMQEELTTMIIQYWKSYSNAGTWQFWLIIMLLIVPLVVLYFFIDRKKIFLIGFFGFNIHVWMTYIDQFGVRSGLWGYFYRLIPTFQYSFAIDVSLVPVGFMLVYQWTLNNNKNFYLYSTAMALCFGFVLKPILTYGNFFQLYKGTNYLHLFILYMLILLFSKLITSIFLHLHKSAT